MTTTNTRPLAPEDILRIRTIDDAQISPDGRLVAYVVKRSILSDTENRYASDILLVEAGGGTPRHLTAGDSRDGSPRWLPDGNRLVFISDRSGTAQLYLLDLRGGEPRKVTSFGRGVSSPVVSPLGRRVAVLSSEGYGMPDRELDAPGGTIRHVKRLQYRFDEAQYIDDRFGQVWVVDLETGDAARVTGADASAGVPAWSPDGGRIAFASNRQDEANVSFRSQLYVVDAGNALVDGETDDAVAVSGGSAIAAGPAWSPDGTSIAFVGRRPEARAGGNAEVYLTSPDGSGDLRCLTEGIDRSPATGSFSDTWSPRDHTPLIWTPDGGVLFTASDMGRVNIFRAAAGGSGIEKLVEGDRTIGYVSQARDGRLAFAAATFANPCDLYTCAADGGEEQRLTELNGALLGQVAIQQPEYRPFTAFDDRFEVDAWLIRPAGYDPAKRYPLVQIIHGGPHSIFGHTFFFDMQQWAGAGWNVLFVNPRASQGYGEAFATANLGDWGGADWREQEQALDLAIESGGVDAERLAVTGLSYGGFMTNWIVGQTDRYKVAVSENSICNLVSFFTTSDIGWYWLEPEMEKPVWENLGWYMEHSPLHYVREMKTPMLFLQAETDWRCPVEQGEQLYTALRARGVPAEMVRFPGESHVQLSIGKPRTRLVRRQVTMGWLRKYLENGEGAETEQ